MSENYFAKFPTFTYSNTVCVDITRRTVIANTVQQDLFAYYPYEMKSHQRPDTIADRYYTDSSYDWLVYLSNKVVDPYYAFPMDDRTFTGFINSKYQNFANAQQKILYWQMNWAGATDDTVTQSFYDTNVPEPLKKYYEAVYGEETRIVYYRRRRSDWKATTNMVVYFQISNTAGAFLNNEVVKLMLPPPAQSSIVPSTISGYSTGNVTIPAGTDFPNGQNVSVNVIESNAAASLHFAQYLFGTHQAGTFRATFDMKYMGRRWAVIATDYDSSQTVSVDVLNKVFGENGYATYSNGTITNLGSGWIRVSLTFTIASQAGAVKIFLSDTDELGTYDGDGVSGIIVANISYALVPLASDIALSNSYVTFSNTSQVTTQHVLGNISSNATTMYLRGTTSNATAAVSSVVQVTNNISQSELVYWSPVYAYDYEVELNERRKFIRLIDSKYAMSIAEKLRKEMLK